jgi:hypothetical protein
MKTLHSLALIKWTGGIIAARDQELQIYDNDTIFAYRGQNMGDLDPHIYAVRCGGAEELLCSFFASFRHFSSVGCNFSLKDIF